jgi:hypothetical protein
MLVWLRLVTILGLKRSHHWKCFPKWSIILK